jgi:hypothetical protein
MQDYSDTSERERYLSDAILELERTNKKLAKLNLRKEELTSIIISEMTHDHEGQRSYEYGVWKLEIKTPFIYSLNKKAYESGDINLPDAFNPIKQTTSYSIDKRQCDLYLQTAPASVRESLIELIDKKPGKASVTIKERV